MAYLILLRRSRAGKSGGGEMKMITMIWLMSGDFCCSMAVAAAVR
jgi:hypothetical protein